MENPPCSISSIAGFLFRLEANVVNKRSMSPPSSSPPVKVVDDGCKAWKNCLMGYFIEKKLHFSLVNNIAKVIRVIVVFKRCWLMKESSIFSSSQMMTLALKFLRYIASVVGKPLYADSLTETMKKNSYTGIYVEIDATSKLVDSFDLLIREGAEHNSRQSVEIFVEYQWKPKICPECKSFGHNDATCLSLKHVECGV
ncbi:hypothetical protein Ddye_008233 [Dipteronia dyeriana]|uniref:DUF4283 domain-containing protein n=1 Tax=Dipteronia dyeriana TaxID=168575 RepID=A0AAE0CL67_9ROSI|nr:hypothetical protein Ddye_008233 [Dipteronia dyeriana]